VIRSALSGVVLAAATVLSMSGGPAEAVEQSDGLEGLTVHPEWGSVTGHPGVLRRGCKTYTYDYDIHPPDGTWGLEIFVIDPRGVAVNNSAYLDGYDPTTGTGSYKLCRRTTTAGRFTIAAKLSTTDDQGHVTNQGQLPPDHFRLRHRRHHR